MLSQRQLTELRVSRSFVRNQLRARRWVQRTSSVFSTTTGPLSRPQRLWQAVLHAGPTAVIGGLELSFDPLDDVLQAAADKSRHRKLSSRGRTVLSCSSYELRYEPQSVMEDLIALGVPRTR